MADQDPGSSLKPFAGDERLKKKCSLQCYGFNAVPDPGG
jgi:hypothetical protein